MHICMLTHAFCPEKFLPPHKIGGAEVCAERISRALSESGHNVIIITQRPFQGIRSLCPQSEISGKLKVYSFYPLNIFSIYHTHGKHFLLKGLWRIIDLLNPLSAFFVWMIIKRENPDIIHSHILHGFSPLVLLRLLKKTGIPLIQALHSYGFLCLRCDLYRHNGRNCEVMPVLCKIFKRLSQVLVDSIPAVVVSPSQFCLDIYSRHNFFRHSKKIVLPNGIETYPSLPLKRTSSSLKYFNILYAGRLVTIKGIKVLIRAFKIINYPFARLYICGEGFLSNELRLLSQGDSRIHFLGKIPSVKLMGLYPLCDITVLPSLYYEILGNVVLESMAAGTPVIASRIGGISEITRHGYNGLLVEPGNVAELKEMIEYCIANRAVLYKMRWNAYQWSRAFDIKEHVNKLEGIYSYAASLKNARPANQNTLSCPRL